MSTAVEASRPFWQRSALLAWGGFSVVLGLFILLVLYQTHRAAITQSLGVVDDLARTFQVRTTGVLGELDAAVSDVAHLLLHEEQSTDRLAEILRHRKRSNPLVLDMLVLDARGQVRAWSGDGMPPDVSGREYFRHHADTPDSTIHLSHPTLSLTHEGVGFVALSRALRDASGQLQGVGVALLRVDALARLYASLLEDSPFSVTLLHQDGRFLLRVPETTLSTGDALVVPPGFSLPLREAMTNADFPGLDGQRRLASGRPVGPYDLLVVVSEERSRARVGWWHSVGWLFVLWLLVSLAALFPVVRLARQEWRHEMRLRQLTRSLPGFVYQLQCDAQGRFRFNYASEGVRPLFGVSREAAEADAQLLLGMIHPQDYDRVMRESKETAETGQVWHSEFRIRRADGDTLWVEARDTPTALADGGILWNGYVNEITGRKNLELALKASEARWRAYVENASDIIYSLTPEGVFSYVSPAWTALLGHEPGEVIGEPFSRFVHPEDLPACRSYLQKVLETGEKQGALEYRAQHRDGHWCWHVSRGAPLLDAHGEVVSYFGIARDISERKLDEEGVRRRAMHDPLTDLPNRTFFDEMAGQILRRARREHERAALLFLDLDEFKPVNDRHGHGVGDKLLCQVAERLRCGLRESDVLGRIGGDEFVVLLAELFHDEDALRVAEKLRALVASPFEVDGLALHVSSSIGIAFYPEHGEDVVTLSRHADQAMYAAKNAGRNRVMIWNHRMES